VMMTQSFFFLSPGAVDGVFEDERGMRLTF
jgi:hypothetical protein